MPSAQEMEWSNPRKLKGNAIFSYVIGEGEQGIYLLRYRNRFFSRQVILERYREHLGFAEARSFKLSRSRLVRAAMINNRIHLFFSTYDREYARNYLSVRSYDENLQEWGKATVLCSSPQTDYYDRGDFRVELSNYGTEVLVANSLKNGEARDLVLRTFSAENWNERDSITLDISASGLTNRVGQIEFDNGKDIYVLHEWRSRSNRRSWTDHSRYTLYHVNPAEGRRQAVVLGDSNIFIQQPRIAIDRTHNRALITALYSEVNPLTFNGFYHLVYDPVSGASSYARTEMDEELKRTLITDKGKRPEEELEDMAILKVIPNLDGGVTIVSEMASITSEEDIVNVNGVPQAMSRNIYNFGDVLVLSLDSLFHLRWNYVINKNQSSMNDGGYYSSVVVAHTRSHLYVIYNDQMRNNGDVFQYTIDNQGRVNYKILLRSNEDYVSVIPGEASQIGYNKLLLPVNKDRRFALLKLTYPN